jgi:hypothetical protein
MAATKIFFSGEFLALRGAVNGSVAQNTGKSPVDPELLWTAPAGGSRQHSPNSEIHDAD